MLVNTMKTGKTIEQKMRNRNLYCVGLIVCGIISLIIGVGNVLPAEMSDYCSGFYTGVGGGLIAASVITLIKNIMILKNADKLKEREIYENDERNKMIGLKTWSYTGYAMFTLLYIGMLVAGFFSEVVMNTLLVIMGVYALCIFFAGLYCKKTM
ncbi:MAG: hypothetical protein E7299_00830 [Lachnospiraceae bacterium]|nr:hypothetical protein [Lachnospiraceae bacterium]